MVTSAKLCAFDKMHTVAHAGVECFYFVGSKVNNAIGVLAAKADAD